MRPPERPGGEDTSKRFSFGRFQGDTESVRKRVAGMFLSVSYADPAPDNLP